MRRLAAIVVVPLALVAAAGAKAPPSGIHLCGANGCATIDVQTAEHLFANGEAPRPPARPAPFFLLRWTWESGQEETGGYWIPDQNAVRLAGWASPDAAGTATLTAAAAGLEPFAFAAPTFARVGGRVAADPASYARLLVAGWSVSSWVGAVGWIPVRLGSPDPGPWTDGHYDLRISKAGAFVWRDGSVYRIPFGLARLARAGRALPPAP